MAEKLTVTGTVTWASETGMKLDAFENGGEYLNKSMQGSAAKVVMPAKGTRVTVHATQAKNNKWYVDAIEAADGTATGTTAPQGGTQGAPAPYQAAQPYEKDRQLHIVRQNAMGHAVALLIHNANVMGLISETPDAQGNPVPKGIVTLDTVFKAAQRIEEWVMREQKDAE